MDGIIRSAEDFMDTIDAIEEFTPDTVALTQEPSIEMKEQILERTVITVGKILSHAMDISETREISAEFINDENNKKYIVSVKLKE